MVRKEGLLVTIDHRPAGSLFRRTGHFDNYIIGPRGGRENPNGGESAALPGISFRKFPFTVVQVNRNPGIFHVRRQAKPIVISFEQSMRDGFLLSKAEVATPLVIANDVALFDIRIH
jgi:hypothetical protein